jgi:hypothetical protein
MCMKESDYFRIGTPTKKRKHQQVKWYAV